MNSRQLVLGMFWYLVVLCAITLYYEFQLDDAREKRKLAERALIVEMTRPPLRCPKSGEELWIRTQEL